MRKVCVILFVTTVLLCSLATAATGWPILDVFKGKQAKVAPVDDLSIVSNIAANQASCDAQVEQNRRLLLLIIDHLGIQGVESITGNPVRQIARNSRKLSTERATGVPMGRARGTLERAPATPIEIQRTQNIPDVSGAFGCDQICLDQCKLRMENLPADVGFPDDMLEVCVGRCIDYYCKDNKELAKTF